MRDSTQSKRRTRQSELGKVQKSIVKNESTHRRGMYKRLMPRCRVEGKVHKANAKNDSAQRRRQCTKG